MECKVECTADTTPESSDSLNVTEVYPNKQFTANRNCIPTVPQNEQETELSGLGVEVYNQEVFEKEILHQVDLVLQGQKKHSKEKKQAVNVDELNEGQEIEKPFYIDNEESERDKKIRMGEMTPFGTVISMKTIEGNHLENIEEYLQKQVKIANERRAKKRKSHNAIHKIKPGKKLYGVRNKSKGILPDSTEPNNSNETIIVTDCDNIKFARLENKLETKLEDNNSSGSEFIPSESDDEDVDFKPECRVPRKVKKKLKDNEGSNSSNKSRIKGEKDDGSELNYLKRLEIWEKKNCRQEIESQLQNLGDDFKMPSIIWDKLYNYQRVGVQWLWELNLQKCGGIIGDEMGLGKTIQIIAFLAGLSTTNLLSRHGSFRGLGPVLIVCPTTVMHQWIKEFHQWWPQFRIFLLHESGTYNGKRTDLIRDVVKSNGILITSYITCVQQSGDLLRHTWHYVILDEGHKIRNPESQITNTVKLFKTPHRLILSGSPIQNNLKELWSLFDFIFPGKLGTLPVFLAEFGVPITQGGFVNASKVQVATAYKCATILRDTISPYLLRRVKEDVKNHINLPPKNEQVLFCKLTVEQRELYIDYINSGRVNDILCGKLRVFVGLIELRKICNHPHLYTGGVKQSKLENGSFVPEEEKFGYWKKAGKMIVLETLLRIWKKQGHRVLVFTQSRKMLGILESFVRSQNYEYLKIDGTTSIGSRQPLINTFNEDKKYYIFLSTTHVGGLGVNLTGADRVVIYDPDWNPATDVQARERAWRLGQENQVTIYRFVTAGTIEEKIYHRQIYKQFLTNKVLKDPSQRRFFKSNDLYELFTYKGDEGTNETSAIFEGTDYELNLRNLPKRRRRDKYKDDSAMEPKSMKTAVETQNLLTKEKIEKMKQLAQALSRKIAMDALKSESEKNGGLSKDQNSGKDENIDAKTAAGENDKQKRKKSKRKKRDYEVMDGEVIPHLKKKKQYRDVIKDSSNYEKDDDYILKKLFSKSGVQSALKHDQLMETGTPDYALVEGEAEKIAKEAVKALRESRRHYARPFNNIQTSNPSSKPIFGKKTFGQKASPGNESSSNGKDKPMSSAELLMRIRQRNGLTSASTNNSVNENFDLLVDIRNFISFGARVECRATTQEIIDMFKGRLPTGQTPLFKGLLNEICNFHRTSSGEGVWELRQDFRW